MVCNLSISRIFMKVGDLSPAGLKKVSAGCRFDDQLYGIYSARVKFKI